MMTTCKSFSRSLSRFTAASIAFAALSVASLAHANNLKLVADKSSIGFSFSQLGVPMKGSFKKFDAKVFFDPKKPESTKADFTVDMNSVDLGAADYNAETKSPVWLNAKMFPNATFVADKVTSTGPNKFEATGKLSIKGATQIIKAQFTYTDGAQPIVEGSFPMKRLQWKIGDNEWKDTSVVADDVTVRFKFATSK
jgi:polyisoprenoid-binding protein YceI